MSRTNPRAIASASTAATRSVLIDAAMREFNESGFGGTDTNRIARRAGFAPQTFYRWFKDKTEIFIAAYQAWERAEYSAIGDLLSRKASTKQLVESIVQHHRNYKVFRRSLRMLSLEDDAVRVARAASRNHQIEQIRAWHKTLKGTALIGAPSLATLLLQIERLADALAEDEFTDMGLSATAAQQALGQLIDALRVK